jgi:hypothetical protein
LVDGASLAPLPELLYTVSQSLLIDEQPYAARGDVAAAADGLACDRPCWCEGGPEEAAPHSPIELCQPPVRANERSQWTRRRRDDRLQPVDVGDRRLVAEAPEGRADVVECAFERADAPWARLPRELVPECDADLMEAMQPSFLRQRVCDEAQQAFEMARWKLDRCELRRHAVRLRRAAGARTSAAGLAFEGRDEQARLSQALETRAGDVAMDAMGHGDGVGRDGATLGASEEQRQPELRVPDRVELLHHF